MPRSTSRSGAVLVVAGLLTGGAVSAGERSYPLDCLPDRLAAWEPVGANPGSLFGAPFVPGVMLGPPGNSVAWQGALSVATLGFGGSATLAFETIVIEDGPRPDFIVFENPFWAGGDPAAVFSEPGEVAASVDGADWRTFDCDPGGGTEGGCAGFTPTERYDTDAIEPLDHFRDGNVFALHDLQ